MSVHDSKMVADDEFDKSTDRGYEVSMPQSQLWFVNQRVSSQPKKMNGGLPKRGRSILPSVKVAPGVKTSQDFNLSKIRQKAMSYRPGLRSGPAPSEGNTDPIKSRNNNILHLQNHSHNDQMNKSTATNANDGV